MKVEIKRLDILQTGKVAAVLYGFFAVISMPVLILTTVHVQGAAGYGVLLWLPLYPVIGFVVGGIFAIVYNWVSERFIGGFRLELELESPNDEVYEMQTGHE